MIQRQVRRAATTFALAGLLSLLPLTELQAAPRRNAPAQRGGDVWQTLQQQVSMAWGGLGRIWEKVGARIDDNGFYLRLANNTPSSPDPNQGEKPTQPAN